MITRKTNWQNALFIGTLLFFALSFVNIGFAFLGLICVITPFYMVIKTGKKLWCTTYCPRANLFSKLFKKISLNLKSPEWLYKKETKRLILNYFCMNLVFIIFSSVMVVQKNIAPMNFVRFLIVFQIPVELPQLIQIALPDIISHIGYRIFSIMFTSTVIGLMLGFLFKPRSWCAICPVQTLTTMVRDQAKFNTLNEQ
ncbi:4Fe-4S binding protein [Fusibacter bizertensis]